MQVDREAASRFIKAALSGQEEQEEEGKQS